MLPGKKHLLHGELPVAKREEDLGASVTGLLVVVVDFGPTVVDLAPVPGGLLTVRPTDAWEPGAGDGAVGFGGMIYYDNMQVLTCAECACLSTHGSHCRVQVASESIN
jgi:hypothetical protein